MLPIRAQLCTGWKPMAGTKNHSRRWFADREGLWLQMDDRRWIKGDGSREMDQGRWMIINHLSYMKLRSYNRAWIGRHPVFKRHGSTKYDAKHYSNHYSGHDSKILNHAPTCPSSNAEYDPESDPE